MTERNKLRMEMRKEFKARAAKQAQRLLNAQLNLALGSNVLLRFDKGKNGKPLAPVVVDDEQEVIDFFDGKFKEGINEEGSYYLISTHKPSNAAIDSILDRAFGRPDKDEDDEGDDRSGLFGDDQLQVTVVRDKRKEDDGRTDQLPAGTGDQPVGNPG